MHNYVKFTINLIFAFKQLNQYLIIKATLINFLQIIP